MPIAASQSMLQSAILGALSSGSGAKQSSFASQVSAAIGSAAAMGLFPSAPSPIPLIPAGVSGAQAMILAATSSGSGAQISSVAQQIAAAVSVVAPMCPPSGLSALSSAIKSALSSGSGAKPSAVAAQLATAIVAYYTAGGIL